MLIEGMIAVIAFAAGSAFSRRRMRASLPSARAVTAPKTLASTSQPRALPAAPSLYELAGILEVRRGRQHRFGARVPYVIRDGQQYPVDRGDHLHAALIGMLLVDFVACGGECGYCRGTEWATIDVVAKTPVPDGAQDMGVVRRQAIHTYCKRCGVNSGMVFIGHIQCRDIPLIFRTMPNLFDALKALAEENGKLTNEIRRQFLSEEYDRLEPRVMQIAREMHRLGEELPPPAPEKKEPRKDSESWTGGSIYG